MYDVHITNLWFSEVILCEGYSVTRLINNLITRYKYYHTSIMISPHSTGCLNTDVIHPGK